MIQNRTKFFIPVGLNLPDVLRQSGLSCFNRAGFIARCHYMLDQLYIRRVSQKRSASEYLPVNLKLLRQILGHRKATQVKAVLIKCNIIEPLKKNGRETYLAGVSSKAYRFTEQFQNARFHAVECPDHRLLSKIRAIREEITHRQTVNHPGKSLIYNSVKKMNFDFDGAPEYVQNIANQERRDWAGLCVEMLETGDWTFKSDAQGRLYHPLVYMPRDLRQFASYGGQELFSVDVSSSHPCLLASLYPGECPEKRNYVALVSSGAFYSLLNAKAGHLSKPAANETRGFFKGEVFRRIFYCSNHATVHPLWKTFEAEFPQLAERIRHEKRIHQRDLANHLQRLESGIIIDKAAAILAERHAGDDFCLISIHDAFLTTREYVQEVEAALKTEYGAVIGFEPKIKIVQVSQDSFSRQQLELRF